MSSACSTSYNIHEAQHLIPACPFNGCRYPVVAERLVSMAILATASDYLQPSEIYTRTDAHTHSHSMCRHTLSAQAVAMDISKPRLQTLINY